MGASTPAMKGESLTLATMWTDPENRMLSERSRHRKDTQAVVPLMGRQIPEQTIHRHRVDSGYLRKGVINEDGVALGVMKIFWN